jgi:hypothetical protein
MLIRKVVDAALGAAGDIDNLGVVYSTPVKVFGARQVVLTLSASSGTCSSAVPQICNGESPSSLVSDTGWTAVAAGTNGIAAVPASGSITGASLANGGVVAMACLSFNTSYSPNNVGAQWLRFKITAENAVAGASCITRVIFESAPEEQTSKGYVEKFAPLSLANCYATAGNTYILCDTTTDLYAGSEVVSSDGVTLSAQPLFVGEVSSGTQFRLATVKGSQSWLTIPTTFTGKTFKFRALQIDYDKNP